MSDWVSELVTRSPIELLWTAKNQKQRLGSTCPFSKILFFYFFFSIATSLLRFALYCVHIAQSPQKYIAHGWFARLLTVWQGQPDVILPAIKRFRERCNLELQWTKCTGYLSCNLALMLVWAWLVRRSSFCKDSFAMASQFGSEAPQTTHNLWHKL